MVELLLYMYATNIRAWHDWTPTSKTISITYFMQQKWTTYSMKPVLQFHVHNFDNISKKSNILHHTRTTFIIITHEIQSVRISRLQLHNQHFPFHYKVSLIFDWEFTFELHEINSVDCICLWLHFQNSQDAKNKIISLVFDSSSW